MENQGASSYSQGDETNSQGDETNSYLSAMYTYTTEFINKLGGPGTSFLDYPDDEDDTSSNCSDDNTDPDMVTENGGNGSAKSVELEGVNKDEEVEHNNVKPDALNQSDDEGYETADENNEDYAVIIDIHKEGPNITDIPEKEEKIQQEQTKNSIDSTAALIDSTKAEAIQNTPSQQEPSKKSIDSTAVLIDSTQVEATENTPSQQEQAKNSINSTPALVDSNESTQPTRIEQALVESNNISPVSLPPKDGLEKTTNKNDILLTSGHGIFTHEKRSLEISNNANPVKGGAECCCVTF